MHLYFCIQQLLKSQSSFRPSNIRYSILLMDHNIQVWSHLFTIWTIWCPDYYIMIFADAPNQVNSWNVTQIKMSHQYSVVFSIVFDSQIPCFIFGNLSNKHLDTSTFKVSFCIGIVWHQHIRSVFIYNLFGTRSNAETYMNLIHT